MVRFMYRNRTNFNLKHKNYLLINIPRGNYVHKIFIKNHTYC